ncbi:MAG TPA: hypothetical protein VEW42_04380 [Candidatus Eisenbacteria bacterium]|nr:hypothetical protein [Candidatus Eisenbacteria bacterium]
MRYSGKIKDQVRDFREMGLSLGQIYEKTHIPKTTIRLWIKYIVLSKKQRDKLQQNTMMALQKGRVRAQRLHTDTQRIAEIGFHNSAKEQTSKLSKKELFIAGVALYWGEGFKNKHEHRLGFCNSDPEMITFYIKWLKEIFHIKEEDLVLRLTLNESYENRAEEIQQYWIDILKVSPEQFTKPFYQHVAWKRQYKTDNYHGVLRIHVKNSKESLWEVRGWIEGLKHAKIGST